jgi:NAD(P)-dependent dehydrogenase (short-subunit alcohol dehydrogenase family)
MNPILLVTGGSRGIGAATARLAAARGWDVAINYTRDAAAAEAVAQDVRAQGRRAITLQADVADETQVQSMFAGWTATSARWPAWPTTPAWWTRARASWKWMPRGCSACSPSTSSAPCTAAARPCSA